MKDFLLCVHAKTINLVISCCQLAANVKEMYLLSASCTRNTITFPHSTNHVIVFWRCQRNVLKCVTTRIFLSLHVTTLTNDISIIKLLLSGGAVDAMAIVVAWSGFQMTV